MKMLASLALALWVVFGVFFTKRRKFLAVFHLASLAWGIVVELSPLPCPLTMAEEFFDQRAGVESYHGAFLQHYLDRLVYPDLPVTLLVSVGVAVCVLNLGVYALRFWKSHAI